MAQTVELVVVARFHVQAEASPGVEDRAAPSEAADLLRSNITVWSPHEPVDI
jgi:hypothetical protein